MCKQQVLEASHFASHVKMRTAYLPLPPPSPVSHCVYSARPSASVPLSLLPPGRNISEFSIFSKKFDDVFIFLFLILASRWPPRQQTEVKGKPKAAQMTQCIVKYHNYLIQLEDFVEISLPEF